MFEELKKKALKSTLAWSIILIIGGVVLAGWNAMDAFYSVQGGVRSEEHTSELQSP